ncbi:uncharacterized protein LOC110845271 isoform X2 [Folsomia candida]|uniref:Uncharacterized protein n=1 Tax=Folsomia candida TaxID=158441 RepID=A0A226EQ65_FOLCA|nr:uncharacterized protein LOC110845271 isoform X2 [Folsomia candida]OXA59762.1 hypothetical protein Fcan01_04209 [Folsomia candida]
MNHRMISDLPPGIATVGVPVAGVGVMQTLMWPEFPNNTKEAIQQIDQMYYSLKAQKRKWTPEGVIDIVNKLIFNLLSSRDLKNTRLTTVQKLGLAEIILSHLTSCRNDVDRQELFNTYFYTSNYYNGDVPLLILSSVTSLAMAFRNEYVLQCIGFWVMNAGLDNPAVLYLAGDVTKDLVTDENPEKYDDLPKKAPLFTAAMLIAIGKSFRNTAPPKRLITQITRWIESTPAVCFIPPLSAIFEMFKWVINSEDDESRLHYALISAIERGGKGAQLQVIPPVMTLIQDLRVKREKILAAGSSASLTSFHQIDIALDRLFQVIQMLIASECLDRNEIHPIFESTEEARLPLTPFYEIMKGIHMK